MKVILVSRHHGRTRSITLGGWTRAVVSVCLIGIPAAIGGLAGYNWGPKEASDVLTDESAKAWQEALDEQKGQVTQAQAQAQQELAALTLRVAELQARLMRIDAVGERLTSMAQLDEGEFDFSQPPALGGPESGSLGEAYAPPDFLDTINGLSQQIEDREQQLEILSDLMAKRKLQRDVFIAGRPVVKGWMSSRFGRRTDPFHGNIAWHNGVDFAGKLGSEVVSVGAGVVTWSGKRSGYGDMVEINHGNGFTTRYAHNQENKVNVGDVVKKGQIIALMGSSGRSTGPHVHFEVYKNGRAVDPASYIHRTHR